MWPCSIFIRICHDCERLSFISDAAELAATIYHSQILMKERESRSNKGYPLLVKDMLYT